MRILQVFNKYIHYGGEEIWVEKLPGLAEWVMVRTLQQLASPLGARAGVPAPRKKAL